MFAAAALVVVAAPAVARLAAAGGDRATEGASMRIEMRIEGGIAHFPGLARPHVIDVAALPAKEAEMLRSLVAAALAAPPPGPVAKEAADYRTHFVTIEEVGSRRELKITDLDDDPARRALIEALRRLKPTAR